MPIIPANRTQPGSGRPPTAEISREALGWIIGILAFGVILLSARVLIPNAGWTTIAATFSAIAPLAICVIARPGQTVGVVIGTLTLALGTTGLATSFAWDLVDAPWLGAVSLVYLVFGLGFTIQHGRRFLAPDDAPNAPEDLQVFLFHRHLLLLGAALLIVGLASIILFSGLIANDQIQVPTGTSDESMSDALNTARLLLLSMGNAILGALFFVANACRRKKKWLEKTRKIQPEAAPSYRFSAPRFWGGLWFRLGEAVVFTLAIFLLLWAFVPKEEPDGTQKPITEMLTFAWLPLISLFLGMFVKEGERLMQGIRDRVFAGVEGLVAGPPREAEDDPPPE